MRALVLSGGGAKGAYQAGVVHRLAMEHDYQIFCGVSVGAINAAFLAQFADIKLGAESLVKLWRTIEPKKVHKWWWGRWLAALWKPSLYDSSPLQRLISGNISGKSIAHSGRKLVVGAVSLDTGAYNTWDERSGAIVSAVQASSAFPGVLTPVEVETALYVDGGARVMTPIKAAIMRGATEIDVVMTSPEASNPKPVKDPNVLDVTMITIEAMVDEIIKKDLKLAQLYNALVVAGATDKKFVKINVIRPDKPIGDTLDFSRQNIQRGLWMGYRQNLGKR